MEINNKEVGVIGILESRETVQSVKNYYQKEYQKIKDEQWDTNSKYFKNKWKVRLGQFALNVGLTFQRIPIRILGKLATNLIGGITKKVMQIKNKIYNKSVDRRLKQLEADFINLDGEFKQFVIENNTEIEEIKDLNSQLGIVRWLKNHLFLS